MRIVTTRQYLAVGGDNFRGNQVIDAQTTGTAQMAHSTTQSQTCESRRCHCPTRNGQAVCMSGVIQITQSASTSGSDRLGSCINDDAAHVTEVKHSIFLDGAKADGDLQLALEVSGSTEEVAGELRLLGSNAHLTLDGADGVSLSDPALVVVFDAKH